MSFQLTGTAPQIYEEVMVPLWFARWAGALVETAALRSGEAILDVACGTGVTTRLAHERVAPEGRVTGLDINASMIAKARELAAGTDIAWLEADVCDSGLGSGTMDAVISQHGYHYFPDKPAALAEFLRVLVPGGRMALSIWDGHSPYTRAVCAAVERFISPEIAARQRAQRETPSAGELADQLHQAGFSDIRIERTELSIDVPEASEFVPLHLGSMPIAGAFHALPDDRQRALIDEVDDAMNAFRRGNRLVYPDAVHVAMGTR
jgi:ubiquinone/menaquinone biosynthesis C-methylase UbiE